MTDSVNFIQPDITLGLDSAGIIRRAVLSNAFASEEIAAWVGQRWSDTVSDGAAHLQQMLDDVRQAGVSLVRRVRHRFPSGREQAVDYTTVKLAGDAGLIAIGRSLQAVADLRSRLGATTSSMERLSWKLRDFETRYRLLFDAGTYPMLLLTDELRIVEANPAAVQMLGLSGESEPLLHIGAEDHDALRAMQDRLREQTTVPGIILHVGAARQPWFVRGSLLTAEWAPLVLLQLSPTGPAAKPRLSREEMRERIEEAVAAVERDSLRAVVRLANGDRAGVAQRMGISERMLDEKLDEPPPRSE